MVEEIEYKGIKYRRYPEAEEKAHRVYYWAFEEGKSSLHREIYKNEHGEIPEGYYIHHKDGDPLNNDPENLEAVSPQEHSKKHPEVGGVYDEEHQQKLKEAARKRYKTEEGKKHIEEMTEKSKKFFETEEGQKVREEAIEKSKEWHRSEEGREWHRKQWKKNLGEELDEPIERQCKNCGEEFVIEIKAITHKIYCSDKCKSAYHRKNSDYEPPKKERECVICGDSFECRKYNDTETCSRSCTGKLISKRQKED